MPTTSPTGLTTPTSGDANNPPADLLTLAGQLDLTTIPLFASTGTRDTAYASRAFGMCFVGASRDAGTLYMRRGGAFHVMTDTDTLLARTTIPPAGGVSATLQAVRANGFVSITGYLYWTGGFPTNLTGTTLATIPAGFRPAGVFVPPVILGIASDYSDWMYPGVARIDTTGTIKVGKFSGDAGGQVYASFDGITFPGA